MSPGSQGERGKMGDHGQDGLPGKQGIQGLQGTPGATPLVVRYATAAYLALWVGMILFGFVLVETRHAAFAKIEERRVAECEAGNQRSALQLDDYRTSLRQAREQNLEKLLNLSKEQADNLRRLTVENAERRIHQVPFTDCKTGERLPPPLP